MVRVKGAFVSAMLAAAVVGSAQGKLGSGLHVPALVDSSARVLPMSVEDKARELSVFTDLLEKLLTALGIEVPEDFFDGLDDLIQEFIALVQENIPALEEIIQAIKDAIKNGLPEEDAEEVISAARNKQVLDSELLAKVKSYLDDGYALPATLQIPGLSDIVDDIIEALPDDVSRDLIDDLIGNINVPQLTELVEKIRELLESGAGLEIIQEIIESVKAGEALSDELLEKIKNFLGDIELPKVFTIDGLQELFANLSDSFKEDVEALLERIDIEGLDTYIELIRDVVANGISEELLAKLIEAIKDSLELDEDTVEAISEFLPSGTELPEAIVATRDDSTNNNNNDNDDDDDDDDNNNRNRNRGNDVPVAGIVGAAAGAVVLGAGLVALRRRRNSKGGNAPSSSDNDDSHEWANPYDVSTAAKVASNERNSADRNVAVATATATPGGRWTGADEVPTAQSIPDL